MTETKYLQGARVHLEAAALRYARMVAIGRCIDDSGNDIRYGIEDQNAHALLFRDQLCDAAINLFAELAATPLPYPAPQEQPGTRPAGSPGEASRGHGE